MLTNLRLADFRLTTAQQSSTGQNLLSDLYMSLDKCDYEATVIWHVATGYFMHHDFHNDGRTWNETVYMIRRNCVVLSQVSLVRTCKYPEFSGNRIKWDKERFYGSSCIIGRSFGINSWNSFFYSWKRKVNSARMYYSREPSYCLRWYLPFPLYVLTSDWSQVWSGEVWRGLNHIHSLLYWVQVLVRWPN
jgi:hypothetical protein